MYVFAGLALFHFNPYAYNSGGKVYLEAIEHRR